MSESILPPMQESPEDEVTVPGVSGPYVNLYFEETHAEYAVRRRARKILEAAAAAAGGDTRGRHKPPLGGYHGPPGADDPSDEDDRDPEDTRDMLWMYLQGQLRVSKEGNTNILAAINAQTTASKEMGKDHAEALVKAAEIHAKADNDAADKTAKARQFEAKVFGALAALLIIGLLVIAGGSVAVKYNGTEVSAGQSGHAQ